jgi:hypothetical protein
MGSKSLLQLCIQVGSQLQMLQLNPTISSLLLEDLHPLLSLLLALHLLHPSMQEEGSTIDVHLQLKLDLQPEAAAAAEVPAEEAEAAATAVAAALLPEAVLHQVLRLQVVLHLMGALMPAGFQEELINQARSLATKEMSVSMTFLRVLMVQRFSATLLCLREISHKFTSSAISTVQNLARVMFSKAICHLLFKNKALCH